MIKYIKRPGYVVGIMRDGTKFFFDEEDLKIFRGNELRIDRDGYLLLRKEDHNFQRVHRAILGLTKHDKAFVDHINRNKLDNRKCNLRICSNAENLHNRNLSKRNKTGKAGVFKQRNGLYLSYIGLNGKNIRLGVFKTIDEAINARELAEKQYYGDFKPKEMFDIDVFVNSL